MPIIPPNNDRSPLIPIVNNSIRVRIDVHTINGSGEIRTIHNPLHWPSGTSLYIRSRNGEVVTIRHDADNIRTNRRDVVLEPRTFYHFILLRNGMWSLVLPSAPESTKTLVFNGSPVIGQNINQTLYSINYTDTVVHPLLDHEADTNLIIFQRDMEIVVDFYQRATLEDSQRVILTSEIQQLSAANASLMRHRYGSQNFVNSTSHNKCEWGGQHRIYMKLGQKLRVNTRKLSGSSGTITANAGHLKIYRITYNK